MCRCALALNVKLSDIKYVVLGHFHVDHAGNIGKFLDSTFVYQRHEIKNAKTTERALRYRLIESAIASPVCRPTSSFAMTSTGVGVSDLRSA